MDRAKIFITPYTPSGIEQIDFLDILGKLGKLSKIGLKEYSPIIGPKEYSPIIGPKEYSPMWQIRYEQICDYLGSLIGYGKLPRLKDKRILDLGSGIGFGLKVLKSFGGEPTGIEIDGRKIEEALEHGHRKGEILFGDANRIEDIFGQESMDLVTGFLAPVYDESFLSVYSATRVVKRGGCLLLTIRTDFERGRLEQILRCTDMNGILESHPEFLYDKHVYIGQRRK